MSKAEEKKTFSVSMTREMLLDLRIMASERCGKVLDKADEFEKEGCPTTASEYREYAEAWLNFGWEMEDMYNKIFE